MIKIGITGQIGFIGYHVFNQLNLKKDQYELIPFADDYFYSETALRDFAEKCDTIIHLAGMNRGDEKEIYETNIALTEKLIQSLKFKNEPTHIIFSSSVQDKHDNPYGRSKMKCRELLSKWAKESNNQVTILVIPNVFGAFCRPFYNSFVATFCHQITHDLEPKINIDSEVGLIYVNNLVNKISNFISGDPSDEINVCEIPSDLHIKVSSVLEKLIEFKKDYMFGGIIPELKTDFDIALFNTFRTYIDDSFFPVKFKLHSDNRGNFVEVIKSRISGQTSFSSTKPHITRGNHFHTRKLERFAVISGDAVIRLRKTGTDKIIEYKLNGNEPAFVDMPIYYTHNIENTGPEDLITLFWCNELFNPDDPDTFFENV